jgi:hypothetical protein
MAAHAGFLKDNNATSSTGGSSVAYTLTSNIAITALATGLKHTFKAHTTNGPSATLNVTGSSALGAKSIRKFTGSGDVALSGGEIQANGHYSVIYDTAVNSAAGGYVLLNPTVDNALLASGSVAASTATLDIVLTNYTAYRDLDILLSNLAPTSSGTSLLMRFSTDGGGSYSASASYDGIRTLISSAASTISGLSGSALSSIVICDVVGNSANQNASGTIKLLDRTDSGQLTRTSYDVVHRTDSSVTVMTRGSGSYRVAQDTDAVRFLFSAGSVAAGGSYKIYGRT